MKSVTVIAMVILAGCGSHGNTAVEPQEAPKPIDLFAENRDAVKLENRDIDLYAQRNSLELEKSGTGVRHRLLRDSAGPTARPGEWATVNYRMELLNGDSAYASEPGKPESFKIEEDDVESGLHEAIQKLSPGDSAVIIIPSYRAYGLIGDQQRVPMRSSVVYHIGLVKVSVGR
ncbi:MAG: FKBP-type peptidyl-prolyl cis-trans isomerase [Flavobacteriales bacterium]